jgi:hypothetical protein
MHLIKKISVLGLVAGLSACASYIDTSIQKVTFVTSVEDVHCIAKSPDHVYNIHAPDIVNIERTHHDLQLRCSKIGYEDFNITMKSKLNPTMGWNVLNGMIPGTAYDFGSRGSYEYETPVMIEMTPMSGTTVSMPKATATTLVFEEPEFVEPITEEPYEPSDVFAPEENFGTSAADQNAEGVMSGRK